MPKSIQRMLESPMVKRLLAFASAVARFVAGVAVRVVRAVTQGFLATT
jgi:hypothetical protein